MSREYHIYNRIEWRQNMYCGHGLPLFMCTRAKMRGAAGDRARCENVPDTSGITAFELKIEGLNLWRMPIDTIREIRYSTDI